MPGLERVVQLTHADRVYTFRVEANPPYEFWTVDTNDREPWRTPLRAIGGETREFFVALAERYDDRSSQASDRRRKAIWKRPARQR